MPDKITDYPSAITIHGDDLLDKSNTNDSGVNYNTESFTVDQLMTYINSNVENLYNSDGTLLSNRFIDMAGLRAVWEDGDILLRSDLTDVSISVQNGLTLERANLRYDVALDSGELELINSDGVFFLASDGLIGHGISPNPSRQFYLNSKNNTYGFFVTSGNTVAAYATIGGNAQGAYHVSNLNTNNTGVWVEGNPAATATRYGGRFHLYGTNTGSNIALTLKAENGSSNLAVDAQSGNIKMGLSGKTATTSTATQVGSDNIQMDLNLWNGAAIVNTNFTIQPVASTTVNELASLDFSYNGVKKLSLGSNDILEMDGDVEVLGTTKGLILEDRTLNTRHRIYLDNGVISIEAA